MRGMKLLRLSEQSFPRNLRDCSSPFLQRPFEEDLPGIFAMFAHELSNTWIFCLSGLDITPIQR